MSLNAETLKLLLEVSSFQGTEVNKLVLHPCFTDFNLDAGASCKYSLLVAHIFICLFYLTVLEIFTQLFTCRLHKCLHADCLFNHVSAPQAALMSLFCPTMKGPQ